MKKNMLKFLIILLSIIFIIFLILLIYLSKNKDKDNDKDISNNTQNIISNEASSQNTANNLTNNTTNYTQGFYVQKGNITIHYPPEEKVTIEEAEDTIQKENIKLKKITDNNTYFFIKSCIKKYYLSTTNALNILDDDAKELLGINENNINKEYGEIKEPNFYIDRILLETLSASKDLYLISYRIQINSTSVSNKNLMIYFDKKNGCFTIFPNDYVIQKGYSNFEEDNAIILENLKNLKPNEYIIIPYDNPTVDNEMCMTEIYERIMFDAKYDLNHLNNSLNKNKNYTDYIRQNRTTIINDNILKKYYNKYQDYVQYIFVGNSNIQYVIDCYNMMEYVITFN